MKTPKKNLSGQRFGKLVVASFSHYEKNSAPIYNCLCDCGISKTIRAFSLLRGKTISCGCVNKDKRKNKRTNGQIVTAKKVWNGRYSDGCSFNKFFELSQLPCYYCGALQYSKYNAYSDRIKTGRVQKDWYDQCWWSYNGLDRIDSSLPHTEDNVVTCCILCNQAKNNLSITEFKNWLHKIYNHFISTK